VPAFDRYGADILASDWKAPTRGRSTEVVLEADLVLEEVTTGFCGAVLRWDRVHRLSPSVRRGLHGPHVLLVGHPYVDIWPAVRPERVGLPVWPDIPRSVPWKLGICRALGGPTVHRQTWRERGGGSSARCGRTPTSTRHCSGGWRNSSIS
jgi:Protein of unknown function (DUF3097)